MAEARTALGQVADSSRKLAEEKVSLEEALKRADLPGKDEAEDTAVLMGIYSCQCTFMGIYSCQCTFMGKDEAEDTTVLMGATRFDGSERDTRRERFIKEHLKEEIFFCYA